MLQLDVSQLNLTHNSAFVVLAAMVSLSGFCLTILGILVRQLDKRVRALEERR